MENQAIFLVYNEILLENKNLNNNVIEVLEI